MSGLRTSHPSCSVRYSDMAPTPQPRRTFQPVITGSTWETAYLAAVEAAKQRRGLKRSADGQLWPAVTNGDMATLVKAWVAAAGRSLFPLWYQFAAAAYGWNARQADQLDTRAKQRDAAVDIEITRELWMSLLGVANDTDDAKRAAPRLELEQGAFDDQVFQGQVRAELQQDGAKAQFKIPVGCKKNGKAGGPTLKCRPGFELERVAGTLLFVCRNKQTGEVENPRLVCDDPILVDDPITGVKKQIVHELVGIALILAVAYVVFQEVKRN